MNKKQLKTKQADNDQTIVSTRVPSSVAMKLKVYLAKNRMTLVQWVTEKVNELPDNL